MFAFDKGQELSEHTVPFEAVVSVVDGEGLFTIGGAAHTLRAGDVIRMPAGVPHAVRATESFKMMLSMVKAAI
jgi:quercetin dioxygenase-like cupin family protein